MKLIIILIISSCFLTAHDYEPADKDLTPPEGQPSVGDLHGEIAIDKAGLIYLSVQKGEKAGVQIYSHEGEYMRNLPNAPTDLHGFVIHSEGEKQFLYGSTMSGMTVVKMTLEGEVVMTVNCKESVPEKYMKKRGQALKLTSVDVAPDGDIYVVDGYGLSYIHRFDKEGKYKESFGGARAPWNFKNCHKIFMDLRYENPRILCCDRANNRLVHLDLNGKVIGVYAEDLRRPSAVAFKGENVAVAEIFGRVSILDKKGKLIKTVSENLEQRGGNKWTPEQWQNGKVISPHGICFDKDGNIIVSEYNKFGRILKFNVKQ